MRHLLSWSGYDIVEIRRILEIAADLKKLEYEGNRPPILERRVIGLLFEKPSLRTRVSFECLAGQTGASSLFLGEDVGWGIREPVRDFIPILTSYIDCLVIRSKSHSAVEEAAKYSRCPVINGLTDFSHPCQALADVMTIEELFPGQEDLKIAFIGDGNNVAFSLALLACNLGMNFTIASPKGYELPQESIGLIQANSNKPNLFSQTNDAVEAANEADVVYTDVWASMGQESEQEQRKREFADFQVNESLMSQAKPAARFLHCLPARRGEEVSADVIDGERSATVLQAENRLHAQKGLVVWLMTETQRM